MYVCPSADSSGSNSSSSHQECNQVEASSTDDAAELDVFDAWPLYKLNTQVTAPATVLVELNDKATSMELDTGAAVTVMGASHYERIKSLQKFV